MCHHVTNPFDDERNALTNLIQFCSRCAVGVTIVFVLGCFALISRCDPAPHGDVHHVEKFPFHFSQIVSVIVSGIVNANGKYPQKLLSNKDFERIAHLLSFRNHKSPVDLPVFTVFAHLTYGHHFCNRLNYLDQRHLNYN